MIRQLVKKVPNYQQFYKTYLAILNNFLQIPLSTTEIDILSYLYFSGKLLTTDVRRTIRETLAISDKNLNNFISKLAKRGILVNSEQTERFKTINGKFLPPPMENGVIPSLVINFPIEDANKTE